MHFSFTHIFGSCIIISFEVFNMKRETPPELFLTANYALIARQNKEFEEDTLSIITALTR